MTFFDRVDSLPALGLGVSTEFGAASSPGGLDVMELADHHPRWAGFLEVGVEASRGIDEQARAWAARGLPTTYHFLDLNLDHPEDFDDLWLDAVRRMMAVLEPAWICGDAGHWHFGPRERGHMLLLPPILEAGTVTAMADGIRRLREATSLEVLPENPPGPVYLGDLHLLDFYARVTEQADTGMLLDCAHLAMYQRAQGHDALSGLDRFPLERIVELHVAGGTERRHDGFPFVDDDHTTLVLPETWRIFEHVAPRAPNLRATVFECERNPLAACAPGFERIARVLADTVLAALVRV